MSGIGNINNAAGIGYTEMTGLGLSNTTQDQVKLDAAVSDAMSQDILEALAQFRAEGNLNPSSAEMEARLSVVSDAARQNTINQTQQTLRTKQAAVITAQQALGNQQKKIDTVQHLLDGLNKILAAQMTATGKNATDRTQVGWTMTSVIAGDAATLEQYFGKDIAASGQWAVFGMLDNLVPGWNSNLAAGYDGANVAEENSGYTTAQITGIISNVTTRLTALKADTSFQTTLSNAQAEVATVQNNLAALQSGGGVVNGDAGGLTAHQWLAREMGIQNPRSSYSLSQWGEIAQKLAINAAKKRSELSLGNGGGIQQVNGQYFVNGQEMSLSQVNFCVRANQYQLIDQQIADQMDAIQRNNARAKQAQAVLAAFKTYDSEKIGVDQSATTDLATMMNSGGGGWGVVQHYLNANFGVTESSNPSYQDYANMMASGSYSGDITTISDIKTALSNVTMAPTVGLSGFLLSTAKAANGSIVLNSVASNLGLTTPATYDQVKTKLAALVGANNFNPPTNANDWTADTITALKTAIDTRIGQLSGGLDASKTASMKDKLNQFFSLLKDADPTFYSSHVSDSNGGPPYKITGNITNVEFGSLKTNFGTFLQSNSTDNQVAQQRLEALNNTRQSILAGMSAFTQGQSQVTDRIGGNL